MGDLLRIGRFVQRFREETSRYPTRRWYIANQFVGRDPGTRPPILETNPVELADFASQDDGMAMDTADLFSLVQNVEAGLGSRDWARHLLMAAAGRITF